MKVLLRILVPLALVAGFFYLIFRSVDINQSIQLLRTYPVGYMLLLLLTAPLILFSKSATYFILLRKVNADIALIDAIKIFFSSQITSHLPGGEVTRGVYTQKEGAMKNEKLAGVILTHAIIDISSSLGIVLIGSLTYQTFTTPALVALLVFSVLVTLAFHGDLLKNVLSKIPFFKKHVPGLERVQKSIRSNIFSGTRTIFTISFLKGMAFSILFNLIGGFLIYMIARGLGIELGILKSIFVYSVGTTIQGLLSITPGGLGFTEGGVVGILLIFGLSLTQAVAVTILYRLTTFVYFVALGAIFSVIFYGRSILNKLLEFIYHKKDVQVSKKDTTEIKKFTLHVTLMIFFFLLVSSIVLAFAVQRIPVIESFDRFFYNLIANGPRFSVLDKLVYPINENFLPFGFKNMPSYLIVLVPVLLLTSFIYDRSSFKYVLITTIIGFVLVDILYMVNFRYAFRPRPFTVLPNNLSTAFKNALLNWNSFPSGHSRETALITAIFSHYMPVSKYFLWMLLIFVAYSRVYVGAHYPTDVIAGIIFGYVAGRLAILLTDDIRTLSARISKYKRK